MVFSYYNYDDLYESFEELLNTVDIGSQDWTIFKRFSIERKAHDLISDKLCEIFDKFIDEKVEKNKGPITEQNKICFQNEEINLYARKKQIEKERKKSDDEIKRINKRLKEIQEIAKDKKNKKQQ